MLFGSQQIQEKLLKEVKRCEEEQNIKVIYGALVGSISKGLQYTDSDYDTRFLYVREDFPERILYPVHLKEEEVIYRTYLADTCFEKIPFWELSSFLQYLIHPGIDGSFSTGLYNVVGWTFLSPYSWDPYGLKNKIVPLIQKLFHKDYFIQYHKDILDQDDIRDTVVNAKQYFNLLYSALAIDYANKYNEFPPVYLQSLLQHVPADVREVTLRMVHIAQRKAQEYVKRYDSVTAAHNASVAVNIERDKEIDQYVESVRDTIKNFKMQYLEHNDKMIFEEKVKGVYQIVKRSVYQEESIIERW